MKSVVETKFKNSNLNLVVTIGRTGGEHTLFFPKTESLPDQIVMFRCLFANSLHHDAQHHTTVPFQHLEPAKNPSKPPLVIDVGEHGALSPCRPCRRRAGGTVAAP